MPGPNSKAFLKHAALFALVVGSIGGLTLGTMRLVRIDPFSNLTKSSPEAERLSFSLTNVKLTHYRGSKLITRALVDRLDVLKDQQNFKLTGVHDGVYHGEEGSFKFTGATAEWNSPRRRLDVTSGAHVSNADFDLTVPRFTFDAFKSRLDVPGAVKGKLKGGNLEAVSFAYNTKSRNWQAGKTSWTGPLVLLPQDDSKAPPREQWQLRGEHMAYNKGLEVYTNGYAANTDGETIVTADKITRDPKTGVVTATGKVFYFSNKVNMTCDKAVVYTREKRAVLTGNVNMIVKPKDSQDKAKVEEIPPFRPMVPDAISVTRPAAPPPGEDDDPARSRQSIRKYPASVLAGKIEYWYKKGERHAIVTESPQAYQELPEGRWRRVWTVQAFYDGEAETLKMVSSEGKKDTRMRNSIGDDLVATWVQLSTKDNDDQDWEAKDPEGKVYNDDQNENKGPTKPPPGFERALNIPRLPEVWVPGGSFSGLIGPIHGKPPTPATTKPKPKPAKTHH